MEKDTEPPTRWLIYSTLFISCLLIFSSTTFAVEKDTVEKKQNVISGWFKPSGIEHSQYEYKWYYRSWVKECPACHSHDLAYNPKGVPEAEITCLRCNADFDGVNGLEKQYNPRWKLTPAPKEKNSVNNVNAAEEVSSSWLVKKWTHWNYHKQW